jgi:hypothetical protein
MTNPQNDQEKTRQENAQAGDQLPAGNDDRSEGLLPAGDEDDGRFDVAEEVSLDQQSDALRHVGQAPDMPTGGQGQA